MLCFLYVVGDCGVRQRHKLLLTPDLILLQEDRVARAFLSKACQHSDPTAKQSTRSAENFRHDTTTLSTVRLQVSLAARYRMS